MAVQAKIGIFISYNKSYIFKIYIPLKRGPTKNIII